MNNPLNRRTRNIAGSATRRAALKTLGSSLALLVGLAGIVLGGSGPDPALHRVIVTGNSDWSIVPANLAPPFLIVGTDGDFYVRHLPLVGKIRLAGRGVSIDGKISADFNAELDSTFSGPLWAPVIITANINGSKTLLFEGNATGTTAGLVSVGAIKLDGRGPFEGARLELGFTEIGPGNTDTYDLKGVLTQCPGR